MSSIKVFGMDTCCAIDKIAMMKKPMKNPIFMKWGLYKYFIPFWNRLIRKGICAIKYVRRPQHKKVILLFGKGTSLQNRKNMMPQNVLDITKNP